MQSATILFLRDKSSYFLLISLFLCKEIDFIFSKLTLTENLICFDMKLDTGVSPCHSENLIQELTIL